MQTLCNKIHNIAFLVNTKLDRNTIILEIVNFVMGLVAGFVICGALVH